MDGKFLGNDPRLIEKNMIYYYFSMQTPGGHM